MNERFKELSDRMPSRLQSLLEQSLVTIRPGDEIDITGYRLKRRSSDGTYQVTVTSMVE